MPAPPQKADPGGPAQLSKLRLRWAVNTREWNPCELELSALIARFPSADHDKCKRFLHLDDRKRAVASRLLQRSFGSFAFNRPQKEIEIARSERGKPFFLHEHPIAQCLNFNVSHEVSHHPFPSGQPDKTLSPQASTANVIPVAGRLGRVGVRP